MAIVTAAELIVRRAEKGELPASGFSAREIYRKCRSLDKDVVQEALELLEDYGWVISREIQAGGGGRRTVQYVLRTQ